MSVITVHPYISMRHAAEAIEFYKNAFGARETMRETGPDGLILHAEFEIGGTRFMMHDETPRFAAMKSVQGAGGSPVNLFLYVEDADATAQQAVAAGASVFVPIEDKPYGRSGGLKDPFGLIWWITKAS